MDLGHLRYPQSPTTHESLLTRLRIFWNSGNHVLFGGPSMWIDRQDLLYSIRSARRAPLLSIIAIVALSLGIGLNAGVFTLLNALFLNPPTENDPASFVQVYPKYEG